ncbi:MAG TPA: hypothetical protein VJ183_14405 [Chloroflexia bacterium]|nr:hypothetical protein [Chloroflexia bacterium]
MKHASLLDLPGWSLVALTALCSLGVGAASLRHSGSLAFPIDDGYIYSNYVLAASQGHLFTYNIGETSGGITGLAWYLLSTLSYLLLAPFHGLLGGLAPPSVQADAALAMQAGHLYLAAYIPGVLCLAAAALGARRLADLTLPRSDRNLRTRDAFCWLLGAIAGADLGLVWGAMSGLEVALSSALVAWSLCLLLAEAREGRLRWSLLLVGLLPWARPELLVVGVSGLLWLLLRALSVSRVGRRQPLANAGLYLGAMVGGLLAMSAIYFIGWGKPLPSSFYAKVGGLRFGSRFLSAVEELVIAGRYLPFVTAVLALLGGLSAWIGRKNHSNDEDREARWSALLLLLTFVLFIAAIMTSLPWFGQEDRYLLPIHPVAIVLVGLLVWFFLQRLSFDSLLSRKGFLPGLAAVVLLAGAGVNYWWATRNYAVQVRNIADGHVQPALWLAKNTPPDSLIASEPIGAVKLFSRRRTIDLVGLTTPATLGTYGNWSLAWRALKDADADYLLFYPAWFGREGIPQWAAERARFAVPDNRIVGASVIAIYELRWDLYADQ